MYNGRDGEYQIGISILQYLIDAGMSVDNEHFINQYSKYNGPLYYFVLKMVFDKDEALDICQDSFVRLLSSKKDLSVEKDFRNYLYTIALNQIIDRKRLKKHQKPLSLNKMIDDGISVSSDNNKIEQRAELSETEEIVRRIIDNLPDKQRAVFFMKKVEGMTYQDIADIIGKSLRTAKNLVKAALDTILQELENLGIVKEGKLL